MNLVLIEDDIILRKSLTHFLRSAGYFVTDCETGVQGIEAIATNSPDLIITDLNLPESSGLEVIQTVKGDWKKKTPIIVLTSSNIEATEMSALELGADDYLSKPFSPNVLKLRIEKLITRSAS